MKQSRSQLKVHDESLLRKKKLQRGSNDVRWVKEPGQSEISFGQKLLTAPYRGTRPESSRIVGTAAVNCSTYLLVAN